MTYTEAVEKDTRQTVTIDIEAPRELVWNLFRPDEEFAKVAPDFKKIEFVTSRKDGLGTMTRWHAEDLEGRATVRLEMVTEYKKHEYFSYAVLTGDPPRENTLIFLPIPKGTRVIFTAHFLYDISPEELEMRLGFAIKQLNNIREKALKLLHEGKWQPQ